MCWRVTVKGDMVVKDGEGERVQAKKEQIREHLGLEEEERKAKSIKDA